MHNLVSKLTVYLPNESNLLAKYRQQEKPDPYKAQLQKANYASEEEIAQIQTRLAQLLNTTSKTV